MDFFEKQGLKVELTYFKKSGAPMTLLLSNGSLDVGAGNISAGLWNAVNKGMDIKIVADKGQIQKNRSYISLIVRKDLVESGKYKSFFDLKGYRMGLTALGVSQQVATDKFLSASGLSINDVSFNVLAYSHMNIALAKKELDATVQLEPYVAKAIIDGIAVKVADVYDVYPDQQSAAIFYSASFAERYPDLAKKFMIAYLKGVREYEKAFIEHIDTRKTIMLLKKHINITSDAIWNIMTPVGLNPDGYLNLESLEDDISWYEKNGFIDKVPSITQVVDYQYVEYTLKQIGKYE